MAPDKASLDHHGGKTPDSKTPDSKRKPCPICGKPAAAALAPFCSQRCADVDLHRWLGGVYAVPTDEPGQDESGS